MEERVVPNGDDPPCRAVESIKCIIQHLNKQRELYNVSESLYSVVLEPPKALCGSVINVSIWETCHWELIQSLKESFTDIGKFIRLRNVLLSSKGKGIM